jgi:hypothetical protein
VPGFYACDRTGRMSIHVSITHRTHYRYAEPVALSP